MVTVSASSFAVTTRPLNVRSRRCELLSNSMVSVSVVPFGTSAWKFHLVNRLLRLNVPILRSIRNPLVVEADDESARRTPIFVPKSRRRVR